MEEVTPYLPLFKVGIELQKPGAESYFADLKYICKCDDNDTPFGFLNKLIDNLNIDVDENPPDYAFLIERVRKCSFQHSTPPLYQTIGATILNILGCVTGITTVVSPPDTEADSVMRSNKLGCSVVFAKFDIDHLCGMAWPRSLYRDFRNKTGKLFREQLSEMDTSNIQTIEDCNEKILPILLSANCETIIIVICGFSACNNNESTKCNFILPSPNPRVANVVYNLKNLYGLIDTHEKLSKKKTIIVLLTLPSKQLKYEDDEFIIQEDTHQYYLPVNSIILASSVAIVRNLKAIVKSEGELAMFYEELLDKPNLLYFNNRLEKKLILMQNLKEEKFQKGIFCLISIDKLSEWRDSELYLKEIQENIVNNRNWVFNEGTQLELGNRINDYPEEIEEFVTGLKKYIKTKEHTIDCIVVLIVRYEEWNSKNESIEVYSTLLRALSEGVKYEYKNLPIVCVIQDSLWWKEMRGILPITDKFQYTKEDTKPFEDIVAENPSMYFVLPFEDYGADLFNELSEPHSRSLRDLNTISLKNKEMFSGKRQFSKVICKSEEMDFIFPATKLPKVE